jgi:hypothetical protein
VIILCDSRIDFSLDEFDVERFVLLSDTIEQLPSFSILKNDIEHRYPIPFNWEKDSLLISIGNCIEYIGSESENIRLSLKDMVLLQCINAIFNGGSSNPRTLGKRISPEEISFLLDL